MRPVRDVVARETIEDLWGAGYTILPRRFYSLDPFEIDPKLIPRSRAYQWFHLVEDRPRITGGWAAVPASRHDGWFMPAGHVGDIEVNGLGLFEKPRNEVDQERAATIDKAKQQIEKWAKEAAAVGISGSVKVGEANREVGDDPETFKTRGKTIETTVRIPPDMLPHMDAVFAERDRLYDELQGIWQAGEPVPGSWQATVMQAYRDALEDSPDIAKGPTFNAILLPYAVANVRKKLNAPTPMMDKLKAKLAEQKQEKSDE